MLDESTNFGRLYWAFVDVLPLQLMHIGKKEVLGLIDLMEGRFDELFLFDPQAFGLEGEVNIRVGPTAAVWSQGKGTKSSSSKT